MHRKIPSFREIDTEWQVDEKGNYFKLFAFNEKYDDINDIIVRFYNFLHYYIEIENDANNSISDINEKKSFASLMKNIKKEQGLPPSHYIANKLHIDKTSKSGKSFYDTNHDVKIFDSEGNEHNSIIRISNHPIDIEKWIENNSLDFGVSIVVYEHPEELTPDHEIIYTDDRIISIYEYVLKINRKSIQVLDSIAKEIIEGKNNGFGQDTWIGQRKPKLITNKKLEEKLINTIRNTIRSFFKNKYKK